MAPERGRRRRLTSSRSSAGGRRVRCSRDIHAPFSLQISNRRPTARVDADRTAILTACADIRSRAHRCMSGLFSYAKAVVTHSPGLMYWCALRSLPI